MASGFPVIFVSVVIIGFMTCSFLFVPRGPQQTLLRTILMLTFASCYLMWAVTYLAQLHPLIGK
ncbi:hypothetical protein PILCRDRAFT_68355 [Piloderma croceum F 1598]|uniref:V-type proton ATPase subunit n=1 Tax=Piloderma croceum (strain F 1598) TaxID=765440 RepID=A0A0C3BDD5_PILCF|nr:hypothetical protein PILCRDRAFT_68355 [Piloderma croceum F 1598]